MGVVEETGSRVTSVEPGDRAFAPFVISCGRCEFCRRGLHILLIEKRIAEAVYETEAPDRSTRGYRKTVLLASLRGL
jgi:threonine dehydrogenase-like Zn-dependent dehydrogenase